MILEGPYSEIRIGDVTIGIYTRQGGRKHIKREYGRKAREAVERRPAFAPNPFLVPLDVDDKGKSIEQGGPFVFAKVTINDPDAVFAKNLLALTEKLGGLI